MIGPVPDWVKDIPPFELGPTCLKCNGPDMKPTFTLFHEEAEGTLRIHECLLWRCLDCGAQRYTKCMDAPLSEHA